MFDMRTTMGQLRKVLKEAPLANIQEPGQHDPWKDQEFDDDENPDPRLSGGEFSSDELDKNKAAVKKFFKTKKFRDDAVKYYANLPIDVYIVPLYTTEPSSEGRTFEMEPDSDWAKNALKSGGQLSEEKIEQLLDAARGGATVWVVDAGVLTTDFLPTPWMIVHAMYDEAARSAGVVQGDVWHQLYDLCTNLSEELNADEEGNKEYSWGAIGFWQKVLTMKSARDKSINAESDAEAEIATQMVITKGGFRFNPSGNADYDSRLKQIAALGQALKQEFVESVRGKIVAVDVYRNNG